MKYKIFLTLLIAAFFLSCASLEKGKLSKKQKQTWYLSLEETACFGKCPMYEVVIDGQGTAAMMGKRFVEPMGQSISSMSDSTLSRLVMLAGSADWNAYESEYRSGYSDLPSIIVRYSIVPGDTFSVKYENKLAPEPVTQIADAVISYRKRASWKSENLD